MQFRDMTYVGPPVDDVELLEQLPTDFRAMLSDRNGFIAFRGGLHVRGACCSPLWHSLRHAWLGEQGFAQLYTVLTREDIPFAEEALGDQFVLRLATVHKLSGETGQLEGLGVGLAEFLDAASTEPVKYVGLHPLLQFEQEGGQLKPGQLLSAYPPFCTAESGHGVSLRAIDSAERIRFLAHFAAQIAEVPEGVPLKVNIVP